MVNCWDDDHYQKDDDNYWEDVGKREDHTPLVRMKISAAMKESSVGVGDLIFKNSKDSHMIQKSQ